MGLGARFAFDGAQVRDLEAGANIPYAREAAATGEKIAEFAVWRATGPGVVAVYALPGQGLAWAWRHDG